MYYKYFFSGILFIFFCLVLVKYHALQSNQHEVSSSFVINLVESTHIIRTLISQNALGKVLEEHDPEQLSLLLDNVSPAAMAFESEVLSTTVPLVVVCYCSDEDLKNELFVSRLENLALTYDNKVKFVIVDVNQLFSLAQDAEIETTPVFLIVKDREVIGRFEGDDSISSCIDFITQKKALEKPRS